MTLNLIPFLFIMVFCQKKFQLGLKNHYRLSSWCIPKAFPFFFLSLVYCNLLRGKQDKQKPTINEKAYITIFTKVRMVLSLCRNITYKRGYFCLSMYYVWNSAISHRYTHFIIICVYQAYFFDASINCLGSSLSG